MKKALLILTSVTVLVLLCTYVTAYDIANINLTKELNAVWGFNNNANPTTASFGGNNIVNNGGTSYYSNASCMFGGCYNFDGVDDWLESQTYAWMGQDNWSWVAWVMFEETGSGKEFLAPNSTHDNLVIGDQYDFMSYVSSRIPFLYYDDGTSGLQIVQYQKNQSSAMPEDDYVMIGLSYNRSTAASVGTFNMYVNGSKVNSTLSSWPYNDLNASVVFGKHLYIHYEGGANDWSFMLDEVMLWNRSLSDDEMEALYLGASNEKPLFYDLGFGIWNNYSFYNSSIESGAMGEFRFNLSYIQNHVRPINMSAIFVFNQTAYNLSNSYNTSRYYVFETNFTLPHYNNILPIQSLIYWNITMQYAYANVTYSFEANQTILRAPLIFDNCSNASTKVLNISFWNEEYVGSTISGRLDGEFFVYNLNKESFGNFSVSQNSSTVVNICMSPNFTVLVDANLYNTVSGGFTQRWILINASLNNSPSEIKIFNRDATAGFSDFKGVVRTASYSTYPNIYALLQRYYAGEGVWRTVQMDKSDEFGQIFFNVIEQTTDYKVRFQDYTTLLETTQPMKFVCTSGLCELTFQVSTSTSITSSNLLFNWTYVNSSQMGTLTWIDVTGLTSSVRLLVQKTSYGNSLTVCDTTVSSNSGSIACNTTGHTGTLIVRVYTTASPVMPALLDYIDKKTDDLMDALKDLHAHEGVFWGLGIAITLTMMGLVSPVMVMITFMLGLIIILLFNLVNFVNIGFVTAAAILGMIIAWKVQK